jgi:hypothetical protein
MTQQQQNSLHLFEAILSQMRGTYIRKNADYGDSFKETMDEYGLTALTLRLTDKLNRLKSLSKGDEPSVHDESVLDTILDIANYAVLGAMYVVSPTKDGKVPDAAKSILGKARAAEYWDAFNELNTWFEEARSTKDKQKAGVASNILNELLAFVKSDGFPLDEETKQNSLMAMQNMSLILDDILQGGVEHVAAEPIDEGKIDAQLLYDYQQLCTFSQNPTEEGLPSAYEVAKRIMGTEVSKGGGGRNFISNAIGLAKEVVDAYEERQHHQGVVVPFRNGDASAEE